MVHRVGSGRSARLQLEVQVARHVLHGIILSPDKNGRLGQVTFPSSTGTAESWDYTKSGKISSITISGGSGLASSTYSYKDGSTETDQLQKATSSDGSTVSYSYGTIDRLTGADASAGTDYHYT